MLQPETWRFSFCEPTRNVAPRLWCQTAEEWGNPVYIQSVRKKVPLRDLSLSLASRLRASELRRQIRLVRKSKGKCYDCSTDVRAKCFARRLVYVFCLTDDRWTLSECPVSLRLWRCITIAFELYKIPSGYSDIVYRQTRSLMINQLLIGKRVNALDFTDKRSRWKVESMVKRH